MKDEDKAQVLEFCDKIAAELKAKGIRVSLDRSDERSANKMWDAIKKGVPLRVEAGMRDIEAGNVVHTRRDLGRESKTVCSVEEFVQNAQFILDDIQKGLFEKAQAFQNNNIQNVANLAEVKEFFASGQVGFVKMDTNLLEDSEFENLASEFSLTPRCMPFSDDGTKVIVGKSY